MAGKTLTSKGGGKKTSRNTKGAAKTVAEKAGKKAKKVVVQATDSAKKAAEKASGKAKKATGKAKDAADKASGKAKKAADKAGGKAKKASGKAKKAADKATGKAKKAASKVKKQVKKAAKKVKKSKYSDPALFAPLTEGERADALRILTEDKRLANMAKVGRYRIIAVEPFVCKPPNPLAGCRVARVVAYDYTSDRCVEATVDLDHHHVAELLQSRAQPMLAIEEEDIAITVAVNAAQVQDNLSLGDVPLSAMHYWSRRETDLAYTRRSAAVLFGQPGARPSLVVVVDLIDDQVAEVIPAAQW